MFIFPAVRLLGVWFDGDQASTGDVARGVSCGETCMPCCVLCHQLDATQFVDVPDNFKGQACNQQFVYLATEIKEGKGVRYISFFCSQEE